LDFSAFKQLQILRYDHIFAEDMIQQLPNLREYYFPSKNIKIVQGMTVVEILNAISVVRACNEIIC
jgi:hypothetical protein